MTWLPDPAVPVGEDPRVTEDELPSDALHDAAITAIAAHANATRTTCFRPTSHSPSLSPALAADVPGRSLARTATTHMTPLTGVGALCPTMAGPPGLTVTRVGRSGHEPVLSRPR